MNSKLDIDCGLSSVSVIYLFQYSLLWSITAASFSAGFPL